MNFTYMANNKITNVKILLAILRVIMMDQVVVSILVVWHIWSEDVSSNIAQDLNQDGPRWTENPYKYMVTCIDT